jgi:serine protease
MPESPEIRPIDVSGIEPAGEARKPDRTLPYRRMPNDVSRWAIPPADVKVLDSSGTPAVDGVVALPTVYVASHLLISKRRDVPTTIGVLQDIATPFNWVLTQEDAKPGTARLPLGVTRVKISVVPGTPAPAPDAFALLQHGRATRSVADLAGIGLDHVLVGNDLEPLPYHFPLAFDPTPYHFPLSDGSGPSAALMTYLERGSGGRQPISYVGPPPPRRPHGDVGCRRPVVAILDTGCADHDWFAGCPGESPVVNRSVKIDGAPIGATDPLTDPDRTSGDLAGPLDGEIDDVSGHGTFIAGLVHQGCPDADILSWRVVPSSGPILEYDVTTALGQLAELARREAAGEKGGQRIDVLSLSLGYYHETPQDLAMDSTLLDILDVLSNAGVVVVASAGNDSTSRPMFPAAFAPWRNQLNPFTTGSGPVPVVSVAALNPNGQDDALFSNAGPWVRAWGEGASVMSTMPPFEGGLEPVARSHYYERDRASIDPDDFRGGFAVWSGTSFAAPVIAGRIAQQLLAGLAADGDDSASGRLEHAKAAIETCTDIDPT